MPAVNLRGNRTSIFGESAGLDGFRGPFGLRFTSTIRDGIDILSALKDGDSFCKTAMSRREDILSCIDVTIMDRSARTALPSSYSKIFPASGAGAATGERG